MIKNTSPPTFIPNLLVCSGKRWFGVYYSMLHISFPWQYICLSNLNCYHIFSHFPILCCIFYYECRVLDTKMITSKRHKCKKIYRWFCYCKCTFISFSLCMLSNSKLLYHHLFLGLFCNVSSDMSLLCHFIITAIVAP